jgi:signal transduction histidine kinase
MNFFNTFRGRLLLILSFLLVATLGVQYYLNLLTQQENDELRDAQAKALVAGITLGSNGVTSTEYMQDLINRAGQTYVDPVSAEIIRDVIIIDNNWEITDSLNPEFVPTIGPSGETVKKKLDDLPGLPPLKEGAKLGDDLSHFPNAHLQSGDDEARAIPIQTSEGRFYVMVLLRNNKSEAARRAALPLIVTLIVLSISTLVTFFLVWRFTRPIANLSFAARQVADGNLRVRVPERGRTDEMGTLTRQFNEMTAELEKSEELQDQLRQAEKSAVIGRLGSAIAHEIRNPLNYINLTLDHLRSKFAPVDEAKVAAFTKLISQIKSEVARINQQISDFLNYSRPANVNVRPTEARRLVEDSLRLVEAQASENNIRISVVEHENVPPVLGDPEFLRSVFNNLFINAAQAMGNDGGNLNVKISPDDGFVRFEVSDTGNGISDENLSKIFEPYFSTKETGTGLGLAIVQKIVEVHSGTIDVESTEGEGTKFTVRLPVSDEGRVRSE